MVSGLQELQELGVTQSVFRFEGLLTTYEQELGVQL